MKNKKEDLEVYTIIDGKEVTMGEMMFPGSIDVIHLNGNSLDFRKANLKPIYPK